MVKIMTRNGGYYTEYTQKNLTRIRNVISLTGEERLAPSAAGISGSTFKKWKTEKPEFKKLLEEAKENYCKYSPNFLQGEALRQLQKILTQGESKVVEKRKITKDSEGNITDETLEITKEIKSPPRWVIERVLAKDMPIMDAINLLITEGIVPPKQSQIMLDGITELQNKLRAANNN